jgi:transposase
VASTSWPARVRRVASRTMSCFCIAYTVSCWRRSLDLSWLRSELAPHYSSMGRPSIDRELTIRMLIVGYVFAIRSERLICREVQVNLAYRWLCKVGIEDAIPDHSAFSRARNERFREGVFRRLFERVVEEWIAAGLVEFLLLC